MNKVTGEAEGLFERPDYAADTVADLLDRPSIYAGMLPTIGRWHAELLADDIAGRDDIRQMKAELEILRATLERLGTIAGDLPGLLKEAEKNSLAALAAERTAPLADIERQRFETLREAEVIGLRLVNKTANEGQSAVDHFAWRLVQLVAGVLAAIGVLCLLGLLVRRRFLLRQL